MDEMKTIYYYGSAEEIEKIQSAIEKARDTGSGKVRSGDVLRRILLNWIKEGGKI